MSQNEATTGSQLMPHVSYSDHMEHQTAGSVAIILLSGFALACAEPEAGFTLDAAVSTDAQSRATDTGSSVLVPQESQDMDVVEQTNACIPGENMDACDRIGGLKNVGGLMYPLLLVHGMGGFDQLGPLTYFHKVSEDLNGQGFPVYKPVTDAWNGSDIRAKQLATYVDDVLACSCAQKVNLLAHSQGGIDARLLVAGMGYHDRVATVATVSSPHHGTPIADVILGFEDGPVDILAGVFNLFFGFIYNDSEFPLAVQKGLRWCSVQSMKLFNKDYPDHPDVAYYSYAGFTNLFSNPTQACKGGALPIPKTGDMVPPEFWASYYFLGGFGKPNDGLVTVASARWGTFRGCVAADHLDQVGQIAGLVDSFNYKNFYRSHATFLSEQGF